ncbi:MAG TPA: peptidoglycan-binding protein [Clostridiales bacterium]|nr:MAG: peptidoglycan-binding protein [Clostridiales bacterium GWD2_32_59]HAN09821.1 peptidoglycan-binding protein [Clostridiales bacterium]
MPRECPDGAFLYTIVQNDNLVRIAKKFNVSITSILSLNPDIGYYSTLYVGNTLCVPSKPTLSPCPEGNYYTVKNGDTFYGIARFFNISVYDLVESNPNIDIDNLYIDQVICVPLATPPVRCPLNMIEYTIKEGDTFYTLAQKYGTTVCSLSRTNPDINPRALLIGQKICVPNTN